MPNVSDFYDSESHWLRYKDIEHLPNTVFVIRSVGEAALDDKDTGLVKRQITLEFYNETKKLGLNRTNARTIAKLYGENTDGWYDKAIELYVQEDTGKGPGIRIMPKRPNVQVSPAGGFPTPAANVGRVAGRSAPAQPAPQRSVPRQDEPPFPTSEDDYGQ